MLEEPYRLPDDSGVDLVAQIGDRAMSDVLNQTDAREFAQRLNGEQQQQRNGHDGPHVVNTWGEKVININRAPAKGQLVGNSQQHHIRIGASGGEHPVKDRNDHQCHGAFGQRHDSQEHNSDDQADFVRPHKGQ